MGLFEEVRFPVKVGEQDDHEEVLQEAHDQNEVRVRAVLHDQRSSKVHEKDAELDLKRGRQRRNDLLIQRKS